MKTEYAKGYLIYYEHPDGGFRCLDSETNEITTIKNLPRNRRHFYMLKDKKYSADDESLKEFNKDFKIWNKELKFNKILGIHYENYGSHHVAVELTFKRLCSGKYEHHEKISLTECKYMEMCHKAGLMYCETTGVVDSYGYDYSMYYPRNLASDELMIPTKEGKEIKLDELPERKKLKQGYYHVKITSSDPNSKKIFAFSKKHWYAKESLAFAMKHKKQFGFDIELITDVDVNAYVYRKRDLEPAIKVFDNWFDILSKLKKAFPKNKLVKHLSTSLWGHLIKFNVRNMTKEEIEKNNIEISIDCSADYELIDHITRGNTDYYKLRDNKNPYSFNLRIKSFLTAQARNNIAKMAMQDIEHVFRIQTDNCTYDVKQDIQVENFLPEEKTTGSIMWHNVNKYHRSNETCEFCDHT